MLKGKKRQSWARQDDGSPSKRLRGAIRDSFLENRQSARELGHNFLAPLSQLLPDRFGDFNTAAVQGGGGRNIARYLKMIFLKACKWPPTYKASVIT